MYVILMDSSHSAEHFRMEEKCATFPVAPAWLWVFAVTTAILIAFGSSFVIFSSAREPDGLEFMLITIGPIIVACIYGFISCRAETLEFTADELISQALGRRSYASQRYFGRWTGCDDYLPWFSCSSIDFSQSTDRSPCVFSRVQCLDTQIHQYRY